MSMSHRFFVSLLERDQQRHDLRWAATMDIAVARSVLALRFGLNERECAEIRTSFLEMLPKEGAPESMKPEALYYYTHYFPQPDTLWSCRDICDFILASHLRRYAIDYQLERWMASRFSGVPVGLPRTKNITKRARNYTPHHIKPYRSYAERLQDGLLHQELCVYGRNKRKWSVVSSNGLRMELTETNATHWLHTRIPLLPHIWEHLQRLLIITLELETQEKTDETLAAIIGMVAQIHWWFSHAMPYRRGSAAIGDMLSKTVLSYHGITTPCWRKGIAPDLEALCTALRDYIENYTTFFVSELRFSC
ncbi:hypothetical protein CKO42_25395 [Lamprobacter modestohalophilus]|uniref:Uncharacterized protein n=1 Tax=Lamprobacter modestohalophilus TaxID=1064514 RepID=A0A9X0WDZ4_9GAMM|nr:hypothetical protein [Lamprobacter modestohalophilus]MBK1621666.1 hypothetical protein [Lamprobacter modestohalophilus]